MDKESMRYEFANVRHLYEAKLGIGERCEIEWFNGSHTINSKGTFDFLHRHLHWPKPLNGLASADVMFPLCSGGAALTRQSPPLHSASMSIVRKLRGNLVVLRHLRGQKRVPYLPEERWRALQNARVQAIVRHAATTVPHYRDLFRTLKIDPREIQTAADLDRLPLLDKATIRQSPERFRSESANERNSLAFVTSGSTSAPLKIHHDHRSMIANIAFGERERDVLARLSGRGVRWRELLLLYPGATFTKVFDFYREAVMIPLRPDRRTLSVAEPLEDVLKAISEFRPDVIVGYAGYLEMLFRTLAARSLRMHLPRLVIFGGEAMTDPGRELITKQFGLPLIALYNAVESFKIGFMCEERAEYHLHEDLCHVKIVDENGRRVPDGVRGEVVISNLVNRATVLLNYRLGDVAQRSTHTCVCGRTLPLLSAIEGRVEDILHLSNGAFLHPMAIWAIFKHRPEVLRYQLIQHEADQFAIRLATTDEQTYQRLLPVILQDLRALLGESARIDPSFHAQLETPGTGKFRAVVSACAKGKPGTP
jgi:phenylacetate-CoA ligase